MTHSTGKTQTTGFFEPRMRISWPGRIARIHVRLGPRSRERDTGQAARLPGPKPNRPRPVVTQFLDAGAGDPQYESLGQTAGRVRRTGPSVPVAPEPSRADWSDPERGTQVLYNRL
jgi:hypothetical protein